MGETFDVFDEDGSGGLDDREIKFLMKEMGYTDLSPEAVMALILEVDEDGSGLIEFPEFAKMMIGIKLDREPDHPIIRGFQMFSKKPADEGGLITLDDLRELADELGEPFADEELQEMIDEGDRDGKGGLDIHDFIRVMRRTGVV